MISEHRQNIDFLLKSAPEDFNLEEAKEALLELYSTLFDLQFQLGLGSDGFQGPDYQTWFTRASYKESRVKSTIKKFQYRVKDLQEKSDLNLLKMAARALLANPESPSRRKVVEDLVNG